MLFRLANDLEHVLDQDDQLYKNFCGNFEEKYTRYIALLKQVKQSQFKQVKQGQLEQEQIASLKTVWEGIRGQFLNNTEEQYIAFASYINSNRCSIKNCMEILSGTELETLMPYLLHGNFCGIETPDLYDLIARATGLEYLDCSDCKQLIALPELLNCRKLWCFNCTQLATLSALPNCNWLWCENCPQLTALPALPNCQQLWCDDCPKLTTLPELPSCQQLYCKSCTSLLVIGQLPVCEEICITGCTSLQTLPEILPMCQTITCEDCSNLGQFPQVQPSTQVLSGESNLFGVFPVDVELLSTNPRKILLSLGRQYLLANKLFPNIAFYQGGQQADGIDIGGVRRHFITKLLESLFDQIKPEDECLPLDQEYFPYLRSGKSPNIVITDVIDCFKTVGCILALCYSPQTAFKPGPLFIPEFYKKLALLPWLQDHPKLAYLLLVYLEKPLAYQLLISEGNEPIANEAAVQAMLLVQAYGIEEGNFDNREYRQKVLAALEQMAVENSRLQALLAIAAGMQQSFTRVAWETLQRAGPHVLQERIEGYLTAEILQKSLLPSKDENVSDVQCRVTMNYLISWITNSKRAFKELQDFVFAVTGNKALGRRQIEIKIVLRESETNLLPVAHTCFFSVDLPCKYPNQETFDEKMSIFLEHACSGVGFQLA